MEYRQLGGTGLRVSAFGLGCGGNSRLGMRRGGSPEDAEAVVRKALDLGVNLIDTAPAYGTEEVVGRAVAGVPRDEVVLCTKVIPRDDDGQLHPPERIRASLQESLDRLGTDHLDVFYLHGIRPHEYADCRDTFAEEMLRVRDEGLTRSIGVTESFRGDPLHEMQHAALADPFWDVFMTGFNVLNPSARALLERTRAAGVGVVVMHAVRWVLTSGARLSEHLAAVDRDALGDAHRERVALLEQLLQEGQGDRLPGAAYSYAVHEPGVDSVLVGTGTPAHLESNLRALKGHGGSERLLEALEGLLLDTAEGSGDPLTSADA